MSRSVSGVCRWPCAVSGDARTRSSPRFVAAYSLALHFRAVRLAETEAKSLGIFLASQNLTGDAATIRTTVPRVGRRRSQVRKHRREEAGLRGHRMGWLSVGGRSMRRPRAPPMGRARALPGDQWRGPTASHRAVLRSTPRRTSAPQKNEKGGRLEDEERERERERERDISRRQPPPPTASALASVRSDRQCHWHRYDNRSSCQ